MDAAGKVNAVAAGDAAVGDEDCVVGNDVVVGVI
jgi:hypothetical protein